MLPARLAFASGKLYCVYPDNCTNNAIFIKRSDDNGQTWGSAVKVNSDSNSSSKFNPAICVDGNGLDVVWSESSTATIWVSRSTDNGATWSQRLQVNDGPTSDNETPRIAAIPGGGFMVVFDQLNAGPDDHDIVSVRGRLK